MDNDVNRINRIASCSYHKGVFYSETDIRLDGTFIGNLYSTAKVVVGELAKIEGQLVATSADIYGKVFGDIYVEELLSIRSTANVEGNMFFKKYQVEVGADFFGSCSKIEEGVMAAKIKEILPEGNLF